MSDRDTDRATPDSTQDERVYAKDDEGDPGLTDAAGDNEGVYQGYPEDAHRTVTESVYVPILLIGAVLLFFPEPATSAIGLGLLAIGALLAAIDVLGS